MTTPDFALPLEEDDALSAHAAEIFERRRFGDWNGADQAALDAWIAESTANRVAWLRVTAIAARADQLAAFRPFEHRKAARENNRKLGARWVVLWALAAASVALFVTFGWSFVSALMQPADRNYSTGVGGHALIKFSDGTQIELNTDTAVRYRMTTAERTVWLEKGEAWFRVAHDPKRPFNAIVGDRRVTDLGTEFVVRRGAGDVEVTLLNGHAALSSEGAQVAMLTPGDDAVATSRSLSVTRKSSQELADELAWRRGVLVFRNASLAEVVREFNRYNATKLVIADPSIANLKIYAELKSNDYGAFLNLVQTVLNLRVDRKGQEILLSRGNRKR